MTLARDSAAIAEPVASGEKPEDVLRRVMDVLKHDGYLVGQRRRRVRLCVAPAARLVEGEVCGPVHPDGSARRAMNAPLMKHNPAFLTPEQLRSSFVVRKRDLDIVLQYIRDSTGPSNQHVLVLGSRGMGKTTLVRMVADTVTQDRSSARLVSAGVRRGELLGVVDRRALARSDHAPRRPDGRRPLADAPRRAPGPSGTTTGCAPRRSRGWLKFAEEQGHASCLARQEPAHAARRARCRRRTPGHYSTPTAERATASCCSPRRRLGSAPSSTRSKRCTDVRDVCAGAARPGRVPGALGGVWAAWRASERRVRPMQILDGGQPAAARRSWRRLGRRHRCAT